MRLLLSCIALLLIFSTSVKADEDTATILAYFMVGQDYAPESSIEYAAFKNQMNLLTRDGYPISMLSLLSQWKQNKSLPKNSVTVTFDGGQRSILTQALPIMKEYNIPFTVFIAPKRADIGRPKYLDWNDIRTLKKTGLATIGFHPFAYASANNMDDLKRDINSAKVRFKEELGSVPRLFSFPYGSYTNEGLRLVLEQGFIPFSHKEDHATNIMHSKYYSPIPRFIMTDTMTHTLKLEMTLKDKAF